MDNVPTRVFVTGGVIGLIVVFLLIPVVYGKMTV